jgi:hypothetical protein
MADPLSLAAAAAGFVGLAGQLAQGVIKLKEIYTTVKDAPKDVADLFASMELLRSLLEKVGQQVQELSRGNIDSRLMQEVVAHCEASRYKIEANVGSICNSIRSNRAGAVRYLFKKKEIQEMLSDIERCKSNIVIARQSVERYVRILLVYPPMERMADLGSAISSFRHETLLQRHTGLSSDNRQLLKHTSRVETTM